MMHKIIINGREVVEELLAYYKLQKTMYDSGEMVVFSIHTATDTSYRVTSAQVRISCEGYEPGGISNYSFIMPDTNVEIDITAYSSMINPYINGSAFPSMGMMTMDTIGMNGTINGDSINSSDLYPWEGKPKFCPECGVPTKDSNKFCRECGAPFLLME